MPVSRHSRRSLRPGRSLEDQVRLLARAVVALLVCVVLLAGAVVYLLAGRGDARRYYNHLIHQLVCEVPPGSPIGDQLRAENKCGPYQRAGSRPTPSATRTPPPASTRPQAARPVPAAGPHSTGAARTATPRRNGAPTGPAQRPTGISASRSTPPVPASPSTTPRSPSSPPAGPVTVALPSPLCDLLRDLKIGICP